MYTTVFNGLEGKGYVFKVSFKCSKILFMHQQHDTSKGETEHLAFYHILIIEM